MAERKFERLPAEARRNEIKMAALKCFTLKGFSSTTMENIVSATTLSKGGVYRIYHSTAEILSDLMIDGMHMRNEYYAKSVRKLSASDTPLTLPLLVHIIASSLLMYPEVSKVYVEFLWEKQRNESLQKLYKEITEKTVAETNALITEYGLGEMLPENGKMLMHLQDLMNAAILSLHTLGLFDYFSSSMDAIEKAIVTVLENENRKIQ